MTKAFWGSLWILLPQWGQKLLWAETLVPHDSHTTFLLSLPQKGQKTYSDEISRPHSPQKKPDFADWTLMACRFAFCDWTITRIQKTAGRNIPIGRLAYVWKSGYWM